jgi:putative membrane protein
MLILCVDRDNDIGRKTGIQTPIIGKKQNQNSAVKLAIADPEEADANAMFEAIRLFDALTKESEKPNLYQVATIAGSELGGLAADRKVVSELSYILNNSPADSLILVTDGFSDEDILPLIQSRIPVTSVRRVVVKHSESIEETAAIFSRYLKTIVGNPRYSRIALGLPGILLISIASLVLLQAIIQFDIYTWSTIVSLIILGSFLLGKGYGLDKRISNIVSRAYHASVSDLVANFTAITGMLLIVIGFYQAWDFINGRFDLNLQFPIETSKILELLPQITGIFIAQSVTMVVIGVCIIFLGRAVGYALDRDSRLWRTSALVIIGFWSWTIFQELSEIILNPSLSPEYLIAYVVIGILVIVASGLLTRFMRRRYKNTFKEKTDEENNRNNESENAKT